MSKDDHRRYPGSPEVVPVDGGESKPNKKFPRITRRAAADELVSLIIDMILKGQLRAGEPLPSERELALQLGVARPVIREALSALKALNIVQVRHGAPTRIGALLPESLAESLSVFLAVGKLTLDDIFEARVVLETGIARIAAKRIKPHQLQALDDCLRRAQASIDDEEEFRRADIELHFLVAEATGNPVLMSLLRSISKLGEATRKMTGAIRRVREQSMRDHIKIVESLHLRDEDLSERAMRDHLLNVKRVFEEVRREMDSLQADGPDGVRGVEKG